MKFSFKHLFKGITKNIFVLGFVSLFTDLSSQLIFPLIPLFLLSLGAGGAVVGMVEGAAETTASLLKVISGYLSDRFKKRKLFVFLGYLISTLTKPLFAIAHTRPLVLIFRILERIGKGVRDAPRDALVAESVEHKYLGKAYGVQRTMDGMGSVLGAIGALILFPILGFQKMFLFAAIPGLLAVGTIWFVKDKFKKKVVLKNKIYPTYKGMKSGFKFLSGPLILFIITACVFTLGDFGYAFLLLKVKSIGLSDYSAIVFYLLFYGTYTLLSTPMGMLSDKLGRKKVLLIGYSLFVIIAGMLIFINSANLVILCFVLYGIFFSLTDGVQRALVVDLAPEEFKATALGIFYTAIGLVALPAGVIIGLFWDKINVSSAFMYCSIVGIVALVLLSFVRTKKNIPELEKIEIES